MESVEKTDAVLGGYEMSVKLSVFEGPLDLLLFLIRKSEIDIYDIPIAEITGQYMDALKSMLGIYANVKLVAPKTIVRSEGKAVRVIDNRKLY